METTRDAKRRETAERVIATADRLFRSAGFEETSIREIAAASGVSTGTVMAVGEKNALLIAGFDRRIASIHEDRAPRPVSARDALADRVVALFDPFVTLFTGDPELSRRYGAILVSGQHRSIVFTELSERLLRELEDVLREDAEADAEPLATSLYFAYLGRLFTWPETTDQDGLRTSLHRIVSAICAHARGRK